MADNKESRNLGTSFTHISGTLERSFTHTNPKPTSSPPVNSQDSAPQSSGNGASGGGSSSGGSGSTESTNG